ncbi:glutaminase [Arcticibacterium luteifluviistationis]|uniref:Glutaminase n=1 Tax=Arcticibacterium luteifluviistationis TaxID=1784714 RepID=A0A2Z4GDU5_9BACT|nr:glutaminase [Arcticibacterium luteifluviistationis]AWV99195.1 glutaminase [Arcticibacterium luteifluviistationis]
MNYKEILDRVMAVVKPEENIGHLANYIPELGKVNPNKLGVHLSTTNNFDLGIGDNLEKFSIQSISKVFAVCLAYKTMGEGIWKRVDVEPSGNPFNSLVQLEADKGIPRNPFINAGAIVICDILISHLEKPKEAFLNFVREISDNPELTFCQKIADSEKSVGYRNIALCNFIKSLGNIENEPEEVLDFYFCLCSLEMTCQELSKAFLFLANGGQKVSDKKVILTKRQTKRINALMQTCGFYDESGEFAFEVGLPGKSGVGGGIVAVFPNNYSIAVWSPMLNAKGNSYKGMMFLEQFTTETEASIF